MTLPTRLPADEHDRYALYLEALAAAPTEAEPGLVTAVLRDEDRVMGQAAVVRHVDVRGSALLRSDGFGPWAAALAAVVGEHPFIVQRLDEWALLAALARGLPWDAAALTAGSNRLQLGVAETVDSTRALTLLAADGRTRRIRNIAASRLRALARR
ncbi:hypothetical protein ACFVHB_08810 [Kitasatospora sp. NPDC127111]|uniref:hypothetical protein n=1 Tax=Kitasatospora sp. NPDC127111 TaxID=3345363 RepID=UPI003637CBDB